MAWIIYFLSKFSMNYFRLFLGTFFFLTYLTLFEAEVFRSELTNFYPLVSFLSEIFFTKTKKFNKIVSLPDF